MKYLKDWGVDGWEKTEITTKRAEVEIYCSPNPQGNGFEFKVLEFCEQTLGEDKKYERVVDGIAYFDGIRQIYFGCDIIEAGYLNYPDPNLLVLVFQVLANLEKEYCREDQL